VSLPNDQATRLGGALLTGGGGISAPFANLPSAILTDTLLKYEIYKFDNPLVDLARSGAATINPGLITGAAAAATFTNGWNYANIGSETLVQASGTVMNLSDWGGMLAMSPGSVNATGWNVLRAGAVAAGGTGAYGGWVLGNRTYPRRLAIGGSMVIPYTTGFHTLVQGLSGTAGTLMATPGTFSPTEGLAFIVEPTGYVYVCGRRTDNAGTKTRVTGMAVTLPASTEVTRLDWVVVGEYAAPNTTTTFGQVDVYLRSYVRTVTAAAVRPVANFTKFSINATTSTAIPLPKSVLGETTPLYPFLGTCNPSGSASATALPMMIDTFWIAQERS